MGSLTGAVVAGVLVGVVVSLTSLVSPEAGRVSIFILMAVVLLVRPQGLFGRSSVMG
jgi:branched-chain amino acid transport system permease protein